MTKKFLLLCILAVVPLTLCLELSDDELQQWKLFKVEYNKIYKSTEEEDMRRNIFTHNLRYIREHNIKYKTGEVTYDVEINTFADMGLDDMISMKGLRRTDGITRNGEMYSYYEPDDVELPDSVDWRTTGAVTGVKNQGSCGSCWAFSATGSVEGQHFLKTKKLVSLSEQNLVDCTPNTMGCGGGDLPDAFDYIKNNKGIDTEESYPYEAKDGTCRYKPENKGATVEGYVSLTHGDEKELQHAAATKGPISVAIDASQHSFMFYKQGVYRDKNCSAESLDHAVLVVGYGTTKDGEDYWIVKNSWGTKWGMDGYIMMARNDKNMCGIASDATFPIV